MTSFTSFSNNNDNSNNDDDNNNNDNDELSRLSRLEQNKIILKQQQKRDYNRRYYHTVLKPARLDTPTICKNLRDKKKRIKKLYCYKGIYKELSHAVYLRFSRTSKKFDSLVLNYLEQNSHLVSPASPLLPLSAAAAVSMAGDDRGDRNNRGDFVDRHQSCFSNTSPCNGRCPAQSFSLLPQTPLVSPHQPRRLFDAPTSSAVTTSNDVSRFTGFPLRLPLSSSSSSSSIPPNADPFNNPTISQVSASIGLIMAARKHFEVWQHDI